MEGSYDWMKMEGFFSEHCPESLPELEEVKRKLDERRAKWETAFEQCRLSLTRQPTALRNFSELFALAAHQNALNESMFDFAMEVILMNLISLADKIDELEKRSSSQ